MSNESLQQEIREHNYEASAKRVILRGLDQSDGGYYNVSVVESVDIPGIFGLVLLNPDGTSIGTGGTTPPVTTSSLLMETGDRLLLETGDGILLG